MSKEVAWCVKLKRSCILASIEGWNIYGYVGGCNLYEKVDQRYVTYQGEKIPVIDDTCKHLTTRMCGRKKTHTDSL